jgi:hypothetical protein
MSEALRRAKDQIAALQAVNARLQQAAHAAERRAELAEAAAKAAIGRAYSFAVLGVGARR